MTKRNLLAGLLLVVFVLTGGCAARPAQPTDTPAAETTPAAAPSPTPTPEPTPTPDPIAEAVAAMTTEQKVSQLLVAGIEGTQLGQDAVQAVQDYQVGGVILFGRNVESAGQLAELTNALKALNGDYTPLFLCVDQEGGRVDRMPAEVENLPPALEFGSIADPEARLDACFALGQTLAAQCAAFGLNLDFAPVMDIWSNPDNTVIGDRAFGTDAGTVTGAANMAALGLLSEGVIPGPSTSPATGTRRWTPTTACRWWTRPWRSWRRGSWCPSARPSTPPASTAPMGSRHPSRHGGPHPHDPAGPGLARLPVPQGGHRPAAGRSWALTGWCAPTI